MDFGFIEFSNEAKGKHHFLQHIKGELYNINVKKGETYNDLFSRIRGLFKNEENKKAANDWVDLQFEKTDDVNVFNTEFDSSCVAIFELV